MTFFRDIFGLNETKFDWSIFRLNTLTYDIPSSFSILQGCDKEALGDLDLISILQSGNRSSSYRLYLTAFPPFPLFPPTFLLSSFQNDPVCILVKLRAGSEGGGELSINGKGTSSSILTYLVDEIKACV